MTPYDKIFKQSPLQIFLEMICVINHKPIDNEDFWKASVVLSDLIHRKEGFEELLKVNVEYIALLFPPIDNIKKHLSNRTKHFLKHANALARIANVFAEVIPSEGASILLSDGLKGLSGVPERHFRKQADIISQYIPIEKHHQANHGFVLK